jgi:hypothetical protein
MITIRRDRDNKGFLAGAIETKDRRARIIF